MTPKIFLSHSSIDKPFIEKLYNDLSKCQISPWYDTFEIRAGKPWLKVVFEEGIPACDAVFVYFTENALASKMVGREIDVSIIQEMSESNISFLPFAESEKVRRMLRPDIQSLQCPILNGENYSKMLPIIVAEIWRTYHERQVPRLIAVEKAKRLELELRVKATEEKYSSQIFSPSEVAEFQYITDRLSIPITAIVIENKEETGTFQIKPLDIIMACINEGTTYYSHSIENKIYAAVKKLNNGGANFRLKYESKIFMDLQMFGFLDGATVDSSFTGRGRQLFYSKKIFRYRYWLEFTQGIPKINDKKFQEAEDLAL